MLNASANRCPVPFPVFGRFPARIHHGVKSLEATPDCRQAWRTLSAGAHRWGTRLSCCRVCRALGAGRRGHCGMVAPQAVARPPFTNLRRVARKRSERERPCRNIYRSPAGAPPTGAGRAWKVGEHRKGSKARTPLVFPLYGKEPKTSPARAMAKSPPYPATDDTGAAPSSALRAHYAAAVAAEHGAVATYL